MQKTVTVRIAAQTIVVALCRRLRASEYDGWCCRATREFSRSSCTARMQSLAVLCGVPVDKIARDTICCMH